MIKNEQIGNAGNTRSRSDLVSNGDVSQPIAATTLVSGESIPDSERRDKGVRCVQVTCFAGKESVREIFARGLCVTLGLANLLDATY